MTPESVIPRRGCVCVTTVSFKPRISTPCAERRRGSASAGMVPVGPRGQRFARQGQAAPGCRLHPKNKRPSDPDFKCHPQAPGNRWACGRRPLTPSMARSQLWAPVASWPAPSRSKRRCGRYPPFKSPDLSSRGGCGLQGLAPEEVHFVVPAPACQLCPLGVPSRTRRCLEQIVRTAPDAAPLFPSSFEPAHPAPHTAVLAPDGLPVCFRSSTWHRPGLSVRGGPMQVDDVTNRGLIHR